ncbi:2TM domain-containing protein [Ramlibacter ginsenosidimutans]|uniref:2TM domain-containing protein n=2 Tax=Ramlibacter ginsenosidimutans TaxID=502333 RepID=A0A934TVH7_9BURK|nr:2TM domain-containing protein [Ramlibacter ginsenosidimutans]
MHDPSGQLERRARRRAGMKLGWYIHAAVYVLVNCFLAMVSAASGGHWAVFPALGWGLGLAIHGVVVFIAAGGGGLQDRLVERERRKLRASEEPW